MLSFAYTCVVIAGYLLYTITSSVTGLHIHLYLAWPVVQGVDSVAKTQCMHYIKLHYHGSLNLHA